MDLDESQCRLDDISSHFGDKRRRRAVWNVRLSGGAAENQQSARSKGFSWIYELSIRTKMVAICFVRLVCQKRWPNLRGGGENPISSAVLNLLVQRRLDVFNGMRWNHVEMQILLIKTLWSSLQPYFARKDARYWVSHTLGLHIAYLLHFISRYGKKKKRKTRAPLVPFKISAKELAFSLFSALSK